MPLPQARPSIQKIQPYVPGKSTVSGTAVRHKLSSNESPFGPSPLAVEAYHRGAAQIGVYVDGSARHLREALGALHVLDPDRIICGTGSDEILSLIGRSYLREGDEAIYSYHGFLVYPIIIFSAGAIPVVTPEPHLATSPQEILDALTPKTRLIFIANPNNPTGTYLSIAELAALHQKIPSHVILVIDEAYAEYAQDNKDYGSALSLAREASNILVTRTFSKIYGMAGLRLGWGYTSPTIMDILNRTRPPFNVNCGALSAGEAALQDQPHIEKARTHNTFWRQKVREELEALGLHIPSSAGNFLLIQFPETAGKTAARANQLLLQNGLILRDMKSYHFDTALRMTIGSQEANESVLQVLSDFMRA